jgi:folate-binding protein YgfZ
MSATRDAYQAVTTQAVWFDRSDRERLGVLGPDRAKFLHNLTTNDVKRLAAGRGQEAFVTSPQGKTLGYVSLLALDDRIMVRTDPGGLALVLPHFKRYGVFDEVWLDELGARTFECHLAGPHAEAILIEAGGAIPDPDDLSHRSIQVAEAPVLAIREAPAGRPGLTLIADRVDLARVRDQVFAAGEQFGLVEGDPETFEALRVEEGTPVFGQDVTADNLPQEVGRDASAISFVKGCYLGQETVARIDALGHVNKLLLGLKLRDRLVPPPGAEVELSGKGVGVITSSVFSPGWGFPVALAYLRTRQVQPGAEVRVRLANEPIGTAIVTALPMVPTTDGR